MLACDWLHVHRSQPLAVPYTFSATYNSTIDSQKMQEDSDQYLGKSDSGSVAKVSDTAILALMSEMKASMRVMEEQVKLLSTLVARILVTPESGETTKKKKKGGSKMAQPKMAEVPGASANYSGDDQELEEDDEEGDSDDTES